MLELVNKNLRHKLRNVSTPLRRKPDYIIVGAQKAGTTTLFNMLSQHSGVSNPKNKEMHFFDRRDIQSYGQYRMHFPISPNKLTGEATPSYLFYPGVPEELYSMFPDARIVAVLRDPVDRAYSHYCMRQSRGKEPLSFEEAIEVEPVRLQTAWENYHANPGDHAADLLAHSYLARGMYADQLSAWTEYFPITQIHVMSYERFVSDASGEFARLCEFLGLSSSTRVDEMHLNSGRYPAMKAETRRYLEHYFQDANRKLYALIDDDYGWSS